MIRWILGAVVAVAVAVPVVSLLGFGFGQDPNAVSSPIVYHQAPDFALRTFDGSRLSLGELRGKPVVLNFWASWCLSCKDEHRNLTRAFHVYASRGVAFVGVDYHDQTSDARAFLKQYGGGWPELLDSNHLTALDYGVYGVPETYFIDRKGVIRYKSTGPVTWSVLQSQIGKILG